MTDIKLVDVSFRDGNQSLWGATGLNTAQMLSIARDVASAGFRAIDFTSSTHMGITVRRSSKSTRTIWLLIRVFSVGY